MTRIYIGTCSWSDHKHFYPEDLPSNQQITYYAQRFPVVEIDVTYYRLLPVRNFRLWVERTPDHFVFDVKAYRQLTFHDRDEDPTREVHEQFSAQVQPLRDGDQLGALHFQFAPWVMYNEQNLDYIVSLRELYPDDRIAIEFRQRSWYEDDNYAHMVDALRDAELGLTVVDQPQIGSGTVPTVIEVTNPDLATVRLHGRNAKMWYKRVETTAERFDYLYDEEELREWVPKVGELAEMAETVHVLFNNNAEDYALQNSRQLRMLLREQLDTVTVVESPEE